MPGPTLEVCKGDTVIVDVENHLMGESTSIHWHGLHQRGSKIFMKYVDTFSMHHRYIFNRLHETSINCVICIPMSYIFFGSRHLKSST